jgi:ribonuclease E
MSKQILIDSYFGLVRTAIAEGASLLDYYEESPDQGRAKGNIYRGVVKKVDAPIQAAFVRFGGGRDGFLPLRDVGSGNTPKIGDTVLVQVVKDEVGDKGAALTTKLSLSGRYLVFIPERESEGGISARITDEERAALKKILAELQIPDGGSVILRTAAMNKGIGELQKDLDRLTESYREITDKFSKGKEPGLLFREVPPALRYLREYYAPDVERIWVNQEDVLDQCRQFFYLYEPKSAAKVSLSLDGPLMFQKLGLEADVERLNSRKVSLPSGANIVFDQAEALVAIDVNSAKAGGRGEDGRKRGESKGGHGAHGEKGRNPRGSGLEETVFAVNKEAAGEIARQLRLRDLGGIIIVDFIDMEEEKHRRQIEEVMRRALAGDKAKVKVYDISPLGIMQISRQRLRKAGPNFSRQGCEPCQGRGWHPSPAAGALTVLRKMEEKLHGKKAGQSLMVSAPYPVANKLINEFREHVFSMEKRFGCTLRVTALPSAAGEASIAAHGPGGEESRSRDQAAPADRGRGERGERRRDDGRRPEGRDLDSEKGREPGRGEPQANVQDQGREDGRNSSRGEQRKDGRDAGRGRNRNQGRGDGRRDERGRPQGQQDPSRTDRNGSLQEHRQDVNRAEPGFAGREGEPVSPREHQVPVEGGTQSIPQELIRAFDDLPSHAPEATSADFQLPAAAESPADSGPRESNQDSPVEAIPTETAKAPARPRGKARPPRARAPIAAAVPDAPSLADGKRAPSRAGRAKPAAASKGSVVGAKKVAVTIAIKPPEPPAKPALAARQSAKEPPAQVGEAPRHRSRRRSRRGKGGGSKGGALPAARKDG